MTYRDPGGRSRWHRLWPRDAADLAFVALGVFGVFLTLLFAVGLRGAEFGVAGFVLGPLLVLHGSSPVFFFFAAASYLMRWGRTLGGGRRWVWAGLLVTVPLWFLGGQALGIRGVGDAALLVVVWNLVAFTMMVLGAWSTLRDRVGGASPRR